MEHPRKLGRGARAGMGWPGSGAYVSCGLAVGDVPATTARN